jgi:uncharacterized phiE125 gp8 family phage protein
VSNGAWSVLAPATVLPVRVAKTAPTDEPLTLDEAKLRAGLDWAAGDPRDDLMADFISAARGYVEQRVNRALPTQAHQVFYDSSGVAVGALLLIPRGSQPVVSVEGVTSFDATGQAQALDPAAYAVQRGAVQLLGPLPADVRALEGWRIDLTCGSADLDPGLVQVIGLLTAHYATLGRDLASITPASDIPHGFEETIAPFEPEVLP